MADTETTLIHKAQKGDQDAFASLVDAHQRYVYNLAFRLVKDENEALDLTQETFVRAWTALPNFKGQSQFRTWLYRIVTNLCYNRLPNLRRSLNDLGDDVMEEIPEANFNSPAQEFESNETRQHLHQAIQLARCQLQITHHAPLSKRTFLRRDRLELLTCRLALSKRAFFARRNNSAKRSLNWRTHG